MKTTKPNFTVKKSKKPINKTNKYKKKDITRTIEKRYNILIVVIILIILILGIGLFYAQIIKKNFYIEKLSELTQNITYGDTAPRGRIYDRNHRLIVDNKPVKVIYYVAPTGITTKEEIEEAYMVADMIDVDFSELSEYNLKYFYLKNYPDECRKKITDEEWNLYDARKLSLDDIQDLKLERINEEDLSIYEDRDKEAAYIYYLMNNGYYFDEKVIKKDNVTDEEYALISENINVLKGFDTKLDWEREYLYGNTFINILGDISTNGIPADKKDEYLEKGYELDDRVGISYLEYQYEDYLRGTKNKYEILDNGVKKLIEEGSRGNDLVLTIDIELQQAVDQIITDGLYWAKSQPNTEYFDRAFVVIMEPNTGEILAMSGKQIIKTGDTYKVVDYTHGIVTEPVVIGSAVKGASNIVGYNTGALKIGETRNDFCIKIAATPEKCSWTTLGRLNDVTALMYSSNSFQYQTVIKVGGGSYAYNKPLYINPEAFDIYRNTFKEFGLGAITGIDLPREDLGYVGDKTDSGFLLDFAIGQYDSYTPIQLAQYVSTMANGGNRMQPHLLKEVYSSKDNSLLFTFEPVILNTVNTKPEYIDRVKQGFKAVLSPGGTGSDYMPSYINPAGKTGTSENIITNEETGEVVETLNHTFVGFAPYDNPRFAMAVLSPNIYNYNGRSSYTARVNRQISYEVAKKFFEIYG